MASFAKCPECKYLVLDVSSPCPSCGATIPASAMPSREQSQYHDGDNNSRGGASRKTIITLLCAVILVVAGGAGLFYYIRQERAALEAERAAQERIEQQRAAMIEQERLAEERAREERLAAARENTFSFPNGISFSYPSGFEISEMALDEIGLDEIAAHAVMLMSMSEGSMFTGSLAGNTEGLAISDLYESQRLFEEYFLPEELTHMAPQLTKTTIAGMEALVGEIVLMTEHGGSFTRSVSIPSGDYLLVIYGVMFGDESAINEFRAIAEGIENSLTF